MVRTRGNGEGVEGSRCDRELSRWKELQIFLNHRKLRLPSLQHRQEVRPALPTPGTAVKPLNNIIQCPHPRLFELTKCLRKANALLDRSRIVVHSTIVATSSTCGLSGLQFRVWKNIQIEAVKFPRCEAEGGSNSDHSRIIGTHLDGRRIEPVSVLVASRLEALP